MKVIYRQLAATVWFEPNLFEAHSLGVARSAISPQHKIALNLLPGLKVGHDIIIMTINPLNFLTMPTANADVT